MNCILYHIENRIATITLNRPDKRNALNDEMVNELSEALISAEQDPNVKVVLLKANGNTFCSGADLDQLKAMQQNSYEENLADSNRLKDLFLKIYTLKKIVVAQVEGYALAGGCGLATVCDFTFATPDSKFGYTEARIGFVPAIVMIFLVRKVGEKRAGELLLTADIIQADQALHLGLINRIIEADKIHQHTIEFANHLITKNSSSSLARTKEMLSKISDQSLTNALNFAAAQNAIARGTEDCRKGIQAFLEKKHLNW